MINKIRPEAKVVNRQSDDGWYTWHAIEYYCPECGRTIGKYMESTACDKCGTFYDWSDEAEIETVYQVKWHSKGDRG